MGSGPGSGSGGGGSTGGAGGVGGGAPAAPGATGGGRRGGAAIDFRRGKTSKERLEIAWTYPVWKPKPAATAPAAGGTVAVEVERALPLDEAYELISNGDKRPILVLRECERCKGTDHALLSRSLDNEQTVLLTHWFLCVKLPTNVLDGKHPFFNLFAREKAGERIPHLYLCDHDGSNKTELPGDQVQAQLWEVLFGVLERNYHGDAKKSVREMRQLLSQYDRIDGMEQDIKARLDKEIEKRGPDSDKVQQFESDLADLAKDKAALVAKEQKLRALALKQLDAKESATPAAVGTGGK